MNLKLVFFFFFFGCKRVYSLSTTTALSLEAPNHIINPALGKHWSVAPLVLVEIEHGV